MAGCTLAHLLTIVRHVSAGSQVADVAASSVSDASS